MNRVWLIRHGQAMDDLNNTYGGWADDEPTEKGMRDAEKAVEQLRGLLIEFIISSPLKRALKPAQLFALELNVPLELSEDFKERNTYGFLTGMDKDDARVKYPELVARLSNHSFTIDGGETYAHLVERVFAGLKKVVDNGKNTLIVSHGGAIKAIMRKFGQPIERELGDFEIIEVTEFVQTWP